MLDAATCCCEIFAIVVNNSNAAKDDNFKILLNGADIGHINNNANDQTGRIFADSDEYLDFPANSIDNPNPNVFETTLALDMGLLITGVNTLRVESIQDNASGNAGAVRVGYWSLNGSDKRVLLLADTLLNGGYGFSSGVGNGNNFTFNYP